jgi:hypothetical protein
MGASEVRTSSPSRVKVETWQATHRRNPRLLPARQRCCSSPLPEKSASCDRPPSNKPPTSPPPPASSQGPLCLRDGSSDKFLNLGTCQGRCGLDPDKTVLAATAEEQLMRIGKRGSVVERQPDSICACGNGQDAVGWSLGRAVPDYEKIVVVVNQFVGGGQAPAQYLMH